MRGLATVARSAYYTQAMFLGEQRTALAERVKVVHGQVSGLAADFAPRMLAPHLAAQLAPRRVKVGVGSVLFPPALRRSSMGLASVAHHRQRAAIKARPLEAHAFGKSGMLNDGAMTAARWSVMRSVASSYCGE